MNLTVSQALAHQSCPTKHRFLYIEKRRKLRSLEPALDLGTAFHQLMAESLLAYGAMGRGNMNTDPEEWAKRLTKQLSSNLTADGVEGNQDLIRTAWALGHWAHFYWFNTPIRFTKVLAVEEPLEAQLVEGVTLRGRIDGVVLDEEGRVWHLQWKSLSPSTKPEHFIRRIKRSLHEAAYGVLIKEKWPQYEYMGTRLQVFRKVSMQARVGGKLIPRDPQEAIFGSDLLINEFQAERAISDLIRLATQIEIDARTPWDRKSLLWMEQREGACFGPYGNSPCPYLDVCDGFTGLNDPHLFEDWDPDQRYEDLTQGLVEA
jgi:hypothetical protein